MLSRMLSIFILLAAYGFNQIEGHVNPELTVHHDGVNMKLVCSASPAVTGYTWRLNSNTILHNNCSGFHSEFMSAHCYPNGTGTLVIKDGWPQNPFGTWMCIVYYPNATYKALWNINADEAVLLSQTDYDNIALTCSYTMPNGIQGFRWRMGDNVVGTYRTENCTPVGTQEFSGYHVRCEGEKKMTLVVEPEAMKKSMQEWTCGVIAHNTGGYVDSKPLELKVSPRVAPFITPEKNIRAYVSETAVLRIDVLSNPPPVFSWSKLTNTDRWTPVGHYEHMTMVSESLHSNLTILGVGPQDEGIYKVVVSNGYGQPFEQEYEIVVEEIVGWSAWTDCSCNVPQDVAPARSRSRTCTDPAPSSGGICKGSFVEYVNCTLPSPCEHTGQGLSTKIAMICGVVSPCLVLIAVGVGIKCYRSKHRPRSGGHNPNRTTRSVEQEYCSIDETELETSGNNAVSPPPVARTNVDKRANPAATRIHTYASVEQYLPEGASTTADRAKKYEQTARVDKTYHEYIEILETEEDASSSSVKGSPLYGRVNKNRTNASVDESVPDGASSAADGPHEYEQPISVDKEEHAYIDIRGKGKD